MKKHSQTDLVSRLKTRKILGVGGEDDDGEVHRSKISQVLGNEIKFAVREPIGLRVWQFLSALMFTGVAVMVSVLIKQSMMRLESLEVLTVAQMGCEKSLKSFV
ncbi:hypothetical protein AB205_0215720 [Aquarana catesbeiana]|uniref:Tumor protein p53-inducible protein 11 n=1 Tax=Aquarana catesbeiana TaxID=8400 RepID=A0A2G9RDT5_AQUCT|nr:hypothetical protein AB205_0215720 [Aquarana catesbeiana]